MKYSFSLDNNVVYFSIAGILLLLTVGIRLNEATTGGLLFDETQSTTFALPSLIEVWQNVSEIDPHPPLHYVQLSIWMDLFGTSDFALRLNPIFWSILASVVVFFATELAFNRRAALVAVTIAAFLPISIFYAHQVRMYSQLMFFAVLGWYATVAFLRQKRPYTSGAGIVVASAGALYSHGAGPLIPLAMGTYALLWLVGDYKKRWRWFGVWFVVQLVGGLTYAPYFLANSDLANMRHIDVPTLSDVPSMAHQLLFWSYGLDYTEWTFAFLIGVMIFLSVRLRGHDVSIAFIVAPLVVGYVASHLVRPVWILRAFSFIAPFMAVSLAVFFDELVSLLDRPRLKYLTALPIIGVFVLIFLMSNSILLFYEEIKKPSMRGIAELVEGTSPGANITVRSGATFWGLAWYTIGPGSTSVDIPGSRQDLNIADDKRIHSTRVSVGDIDPNQEYWIIERLGTDVNDLSENLLIQSERYQVYEGFFMQRLVGVGEEVNLSERIASLTEQHTVSQNLIRNSNFANWDGQTLEHWQVNVGGDGNSVNSQSNGIRLINDDYSSHPERLGLNPGNTWGQMNVNGDEVYIIAIEVSEVRQGGVEATFWGPSVGHQPIDVITTPGVYVYGVWAQGTRPTVRPLPNSDVTLADYSLYWVIEPGEDDPDLIPNQDNPVVELLQDNFTDEDFEPGEDDSDLIPNQDNPVVEPPQDDFTGEDFEGVFVKNPDFSAWNGEQAENWNISVGGEGNEFSRTERGIRLINDDYLLAPERMELIPHDGRVVDTDVNLYITPNITYDVIFHVDEVSEGGIDLTLWSRATSHQVIDTITEAGEYTYEVIAEGTRPTIRPLPESDVVISYFSIEESDENTLEIASDDRLDSELLYYTVLNERQEDTTQSWVINEGAEDNEVTFADDGLLLINGSYLTAPERVEIIPVLNSAIQIGSSYQFRVAIVDVEAGGMDITLWSEDVGHQLIARVTEPGDYVFDSIAHGLRPTIRPLPNSSITLESFSIREIIDVESGS